MGKEENKLHYECSKMLKRPSKVKLVEDVLFEMNNLKKKHKQLKDEEFKDDEFKEEPFDDDEFKEPDFELSHFKYPDPEINFLEMLLKICGCNKNV